MQMKSTIRLLFLLLAANSINAQIVIDQSDMPSAGDTIRQSASIDFGFLNYEETGNDFTWDFTGLMPFSQSVDTFVSVQETPWLYQLVFFTSSNLAQKLIEFDQFPGFQVTDAYNYFKNSSSDYRLVGNAVTLNGIPIPNKFQNPDIIYRFPLAIGNLDSSQSSYEISIPGLGYTGGWKKRVNLADGWGTLITPFGSFEVIRIKSEIIQYDSIYIDSLGFGLPVTREYTEYKWLGQDFGVPLCTVVDDGIIPTISYIDSVRDLMIAREDEIMDHKTTRIFPNPVRDEMVIELYLNSPHDLQIEIYSLSGARSTELYHQYTNAGSFRKAFEVTGLGLRKEVCLIVIKSGNTLICKKVMIL
jgi:hypothetical protein